MYGIFVQSPEGEDILYANKIFVSKEDAILFICEIDTELNHNFSYDILPLETVDVDSYLNQEIKNKIGDDKCKYLDDHLHIYKKYMIGISIICDYTFSVLGSDPTTMYSFEDIEDSVRLIAYNDDYGTYEYEVIVDSSDPHEPLLDYVKELAKEKHKELNPSY